LQSRSSLNGAFPYTQRGEETRQPSLLVYAFFSAAVMAAVRLS
jgi:hypothetical protein